MLVIAVLAVPTLLMSMLIGMERLQVALMGAESAVPARPHPASAALSQPAETPSVPAS